MSEKRYVFNHYIPKFILKNFATESYNGDQKLSRVWIYDIINNSFDFLETRRAMGFDKLYWDETQHDKTKLERDLNTKLEQIVSKLFAKTIYEADKIVELSRGELGEIKRYMLAQMTRISFDKSHEVFYSGENGKFVLEQFSTILKMQGRKAPIKDFTHLSEKETMLHDLRIVVETPFDKIHEHEDATVGLLNHASFMNSAYLGFWKADESNDFVLTDTYLVNERDPMVPCEIDGKVFPIHARSKTILDLLERYKDANEKNPTQDYAELQKLFFSMINMHENVWFFPIAPNLSIVLISPFFKALITNNLLKENMDLVVKNGIFTNIDLKYFEPNFAKYARQEEINGALERGKIISVTQFYSNDDKYTYNVQKLDAKTTQYINMLMLDRAAKLLVVKSKSKITKSVKYYLDYDCDCKLVDYLPLYRKLKEID